MAHGSWLIAPNSNSNHDPRSCNKVVMTSSKARAIQTFEISIL